MKNDENDDSFDGLQKQLFGHHQKELMKFLFIDSFLVMIFVKDHGKGDDNGVLNDDNLDDNG